MGAMVGLGAHGYEVRDFLPLPSSGAGFLLKCLWHGDGKIVLMLSHHKKPTDKSFPRLQTVSASQRKSYVSYPTTERT